MPNFPTSRVAVNLLLIVIMAFQPVAIAWGAADCVESDPLSGEVGCSCCSGSQEEERGASCCCCRPQTQAAASDSDVAEASTDQSRAGSCCAAGRKQAKDPNQAKSAELRDQLAVPQDGGGELGQPDEDVLVRSICRCHLDSQPMGDPAPERGSSRVRSVPTLLAMDQESIVGNRGIGLQPTLHGVKPEVPVHFSQVHLCIWRL